MVLFYFVIKLLQIRNMTEKIKTILLKNNKQLMLVLVFAVVIMFWAIFDSVMQYITPLLIQEQGFSNTAIGLIIGFSSVAGAAFDFFIYKIFKNTDFRRIILVMFAICFFYPLLLWQTKSVWMFLFAMAVWGIYYDLYGFGAFNFVAKYIKRKDSASSFGLIQIFKSAGNIIAPLIIGLLVGLSKATSGEIKIAGETVVFGKSNTNKKVGYLPELPSMYAWMSGQEYLEFIADIFDMQKSEKKSKISKLLKLVNLTDAKNRRISTYSGGMKQRLGIAQALINDPEVIILDEPVSALDPIGRKEVLEVIEKLKTNRTILFSTHILSDVDRICDDVIIINKGKLVISSPLAELKSKYASPILEIEFACDPTKIISTIKKEKWVQKVDQKSNKLRIWITDTSIVEKNIPINFLLSQKIGILKYGLTLPETEDLFIELLGDGR